jgi:hypothetical protein
MPRVLVYLGLAANPDGSPLLPRSAAKPYLVVSGVGLLLVVVGAILLLLNESPLWLAFSAPGAVLVVASAQLERRARRRLGDASPVRDEG